MIKNLYKIMDTHYEKIKDDVAITVDMQDANFDEMNDEAYDRLRPGSPYMFKELIKEELFSPKKYI